MRDPNRIKLLLNALEEEWSKVPDWRFGQLICNMLGELKIDPFYIEDDEMVEIIKNYFNKE